MSVSTDLQAMIWRRLVADPTLTALVAGRVLDKAPASAQMPFVEFGDDDDLPDDAECIRGLTVVQTIHGWSQAQDGKREAKEIRDAVRNALHEWRGDETIATGPLRVIGTSVEDDPDGVSVHAVLRVSIPCEY